jgi:hypothetical protein
LFMFCFHSLSGGSRFLVGLSKNIK